MLPTDHRWDHRAGLTLLGDAAHLMTPFAGEDVNLAMLNTLELANGIIKSVENEGASLDEGVMEFENKMFERAGKKAKKTWRNLNMIFEEDAPRGFVQFFLDAFGAVAS